MAYKKFLETKQAQQDFKRLKEMLKTATPEEKVEIERKLEEVNKIRAAEMERQKKMASIQAKMPAPYVKPVTKISVKVGTKGAMGVSGGCGYCERIECAFSGCSLWIRVGVSLCICM